MCKNHCAEQRQGAVFRAVNRDFSLELFTAVYDKLLTIIQYAHSFTNYIP
jgi:hypothetical protein